MKAKKLFPDLSFKRLWDKIKDLEDKVGEGSSNSGDTAYYDEETGTLYINSTSGAYSYDSSTKTLYLG